MSKMTRSYSLDPAVAKWLDRQPDGRGLPRGYRSRSMLVSEAVFYYHMHSEDNITTQNRKLREINALYLEELRILRSRKGLFHRLKMLLKR